MTTQEYCDTLTKLIKGLKKDLGAVNIRQGYKGTGTRSYRRQLFVTFANEVCIDLWVDDGVLGLGGVIRSGFGKIPYSGPDGDLTPQAVYALCVEKLRPLTVPRTLPQG